MSFAIKAYVKNLDKLIKDIKSDEYRLVKADLKSRSSVGVSGRSLFSSFIKNDKKISNVAREYDKPYFQTGIFKKRFLKRKSPYRFMAGVGRYIITRKGLEVGVAKKRKPKSFNSSLSKVLNTIQTNRTITITKKMRGLFSATSYPLKRTTKSVKIKKRYYMIDTYRKLKTTYLNTYNNKLKEVLK